MASPQVTTVDVEKAPLTPPQFNNPEPEYPHGKKLALIIFANALAMFLVALVSLLPSMFLLTSHPHHLFPTSNQANHIPRTAP
jgi:hypothetical protein